MLTNPNPQLTGLIIERQEGMHKKLGMQSTMYDLKLGIHCNDLFPTVIIQM